MPRALPITRDEAEMLVDLLEADEQQNKIRQDLAAEIRQLFGMSTRAEQEKRKAMWAPRTI